MTKPPTDPQRRSPSSPLRNAGARTPAPGRFPCDTHTHTARCGHAGGSDEAFVEAAIARGLDAIAVTEHAPFYWLPPERHDPTLAMAAEELPRYVDDMLALAERYRGRIEVLCGVEADYIAGQEEALAASSQPTPSTWCWARFTGWTAGCWTPRPRWCAIARTRRRWT